MPASKFLGVLNDASLAARIYLTELRQLVAERDVEEQFLRHGFAWSAAWVEAFGAVAAWAGELSDAGRLTQLERLLAIIAGAEIIARLAHGIEMSQDEVFRPDDAGAQHAVQRLLADSAVAKLRRETLAVNLAALLEIVAEVEHFGDVGDDETLSAMRAQCRALVRREIAPFAQEWHLDDQLIPLATVRTIADLGVFGLTIAEAQGGLGLGKLTMCAVTEELARGSIGAGSLGTRAEIAAELISAAGTDNQKNRYLPAIAAGDILPTAVFTEPEAGSDLGAIATRATRDGDHYVIEGAKTWITHAARADLMTLLARTGTGAEGNRGLTMFLIDKQRGTIDDPFPDVGITGYELPVLGYRGMKEYGLNFANFRVPANAVLGAVEKAGFKQLMATFESARIQTAARAIGVAVAAMEQAFDYAVTRRQFGKSLIGFERVQSKLARMVVETMAVRQLTYLAARKKDQGGRCDVEAGMAKLLAARLAWVNADNTLQIHGGNGYALENPVSRLLCDARILNIFEGAAEIQAEIIARGLLGSADD